jgi:hypothetical protein
VSGMDIHTLQSRPSQLLLSSSPRYTSGPGASSQPVLTPWTATAQASRARQNLDSSTYNRALLYSSLAPSRRPELQTKKSDIGLGKKVGGWVFGKWGAAPTPADPGPSESSAAKGRTPSDVASIASKGSGASSERTPKAADKKSEVRLRPSGVNQSGPIWGFFDVPPTPTKVVVTDLDAEALGEALAE